MKDPIAMAKTAALKSASTPVVVASVPPKTAKAAKKAPTTTLRHLALEMAEAHGLPKKQANVLLLDLVERITKHLKKGASIRMTGLGVLQVRKRAARKGRNPATGEAIKIKASKKVAFRAAKELKASI
jgi:DNA-binding protein HU-beta